MRGAVSLDIYTVYIHLSQHKDLDAFKKAVVGLSGGIDSALVATLAVDALGSGAVTGVTMPGSYSSRGSWKDSQELAKRLGIEFRIQPIKKKYELFLFV